MNKPEPFYVEFEIPSKDQLQIEFDVVVEDTFSGNPEYMCSLVVYSRGPGGHTYRKEYDDYVSMYEEIEEILPNILSSDFVEEYSADMVLYEIEKRGTYVTSEIIFREVREKEMKKDIDLEVMWDLLDAQSRTIT